MELLCCNRLGTLTKAHSDSLAFGLKPLIKGDDPRHSGALACCS